ncbi:hypothetical protein F892_00026 [Acinetobacter vivianii]|uniref:Uncharacterized protein n=1 Tax=Acinetobacter vivianii TaxID=1776742 RepID=N9Q4J0_9GAMM|nr:DUF6685 family protein [Acinetobacter vivianii]ENX24876.1 hypothetical protein F892_00026 [Acinetobacter vivianii]GGI62135.1 hypothetical protein GCM10011446_36300 [Acinetobacter vivianii]
MFNIQFFKQDEEQTAYKNKELEQALYSYEQNKIYWLNKNSIRASSIAQLDRLHEILNGYYKDIWGNYNIEDIQELSHYLKSIFIKKTIKAHTIDISDINGFSASKSPLNDFINMTHFVEQRCLKYFEVTEDYLEKNLAWKEIKIINQKHTSDHFRMHGWSDKLFLINDGGSHHLASAQYIASRLNTQVSITGRLDLISLDRTGLNNFLKIYSSILIPRSDFSYLYEKFDLSEYKILFYTSNFLPAESILLIYKHGELSDSLDAQLKSLFTDFNIELIKFYEYQKYNQRFQNYHSHINTLNDL